MLTIADFKPGAKVRRPGWETGTYWLISTRYNAVVDGGKYVKTRGIWYERGHRMSVECHSLLFPIDTVWEIAK